MKTFYLLSLSTSRVIITLIGSILSELWKVLNQFLLDLILKAQKSPLFQKNDFSFYIIWEGHFFSVSGCWNID